MNKAEEEANKRYNITRGDDIQETSGIDMQRASDFIEGYHQAEKDLKGSLVAEIEERYNECLKRAKIIDSDYWNNNADAYHNVLAILNDTFEVKECEEWPYVTKKVGSYTTTTNVIFATNKLQKGEKV